MEQTPKQKPEWTPQDATDAFASFVVPATNQTSPTKGKNEKLAKSNLLSSDDYVSGILSNNRVILSRAITLIESNSPSHFELAQEIITKILPFSGKSIRIGITGSPGVGKSTFIEAFGKYLTNHGYKVAVLAIDPSSTKSRGSILGDKTRMEELSRDKNAFIRPSPSAGTLGGVARKTRETMFICEAAGYDVILIETVGVGQSEITVRSMVDYFLVLLLPGAGDELQGIKKGVIELADGIIVNKAEGDNLNKAKLTQSAYKNALHLLTHQIPNYIPSVLIASALNGTNIDEAYNEILKFIKLTKENHLFDERRKGQLIEWFNSLLNEAIHNKLFGNLTIQSLIKNIQSDILNLQISPVNAVNYVIKHIFPEKK